MTEVNAIERSPSMLKNYIEITKPRLSIVVVFSSIAGYFLAANTYEWQTLVLLCIGGYFLVGS
ncbi:MAG: protoheme IX farnesyltransferase, partial [Nonlabens sp.]